MQYNVVEDLSGPGKNRLMRIRMR